jgi:Spy/CpxP family protein refolding chaperone
MNQRSKLVALLLLLLTFSVGALAGMALEEGLGIDWFEFLDEDSDDGSELLTGIDLSSDQRERIDAILERQEDSLEDYWETRLPEIQGLLQQTYAEIGGILNENQREVFQTRVRALGGRVPQEIRD